jgi:PEGA domain
MTKARTLLALAAATLAAAGCVERQMTVRSIPPGAELYLDGQRVGETPIVLPFTDYGVRDMVLRKPGYHVERRFVEMEEPYFQRFPVDFYYEVLTKDLYTDHREYQFVLVPNTEEDLSRAVIDQQMKLAEEMRKR